MPKDDSTHSRNLVPLSSLQRSLARISHPYHIMPSVDIHHDDDTKPSMQHDTSDLPAPLKCQWEHCSKSYSDADVLYNHLCNDHIGRKSTNNLCLTCKWKDCGTSCAKRDHITSHLRVHTPLKPHVCEVCNKSFKRPQDLKKHEKIHTEEHHAQHKHSKAITVVDPSYVQRVRGEAPKSAPTRTQHDTLEPPRITESRPKAGSVSSHGTPELSPPSSMPSISSVSPDFGLLPTPSPEFSHSQPYPHHRHSQSSDFALSTQLPSWQILRDDGSQAPAAASAGAKRSHDTAAIDDFFTDMKKRRVNPRYDPRQSHFLYMAERLTNIAYATQQQQQQQYSSNFNPRHVSFDVRTPEELAAVNQFLLTLGRDVDGTNPMRSPQQQQPLTPSDYNPSSYFDAASLSQLGLAGLPGMPGSSDSLYSQSGYSSPPQSSYTTQQAHRSLSVDYGSLYPAVHDVPYSTHIRAPRLSGSFGPQASSHHQQQHYSPTHTTSFYQPQPHSHFRPTPPLSSPHSPMSTPSSGGTPPLHPATISLSGGSSSSPTSGFPVQMQIPDGAAAFDALRASARNAPVPQLAPLDYATKTLRTVVPLKTAPSTYAAASRLVEKDDESDDEPKAPARREGEGEVERTPPRPMEPRLRTPLQRGPPARLTSDALASSSSSSAAASGISSRSSLYPLLTDSDAHIRLPPLSHMYRTPSPSSPSPSHSSLGTPRALSPSDSTTSASPRAQLTILPSLRSITSRSTLPSSSSSAVVDEGFLARGVDRIGLGARAESPNPAAGSGITASSSSMVAGGEIPSEVRRTHAALIRDFLVAINTDYKARFLAPSVAVSGARDVEMGAA
ncbi:hypothetical protein BD410DRAFT_894317 [Rickenella mellea]|uniref:C2H2-type domain-containing protein n=1 Tax=Rickenella mellea TaxID=50990 RepID=A0A4Y7QLD5_9AGAM|nr:hypothetical protein BD410DRAFT_894317 [Rickenella mellea]